VQVAGRRHCATAYGTEDEAKLELARFVESVGSVRADAYDMTLDEFAEGVWFPRLERMGRAKSTLKDYRGVYRRHIQPRFGSMPLRAITGREVREWVWEVPEGAADKAFRVLRACLRFAYDNEYVAEKPLDRRVEKPSARPRTKRLWDAATVADVVERIRGWKYETVALLMLGGGLRREEAVAARSDLVEVLDGGRLLRVHVEEAYTPEDGLKSLKTRSSYRVAVVGEPFASRIVETWDGYRAGSAGVGMVDPNHMTREWKKLYDEGGRLEGVEPYVTFGQLRHVHETLMLETGANAALVSKLHGHSERVEYRHYLGVTDSMAEDAAKAVGLHVKAAADAECIRCAYDGAAAKKNEAGNDAPDLVE
jgi:integrase